MPAASMPTSAGRRAQRQGAPQARPQSRTMDRDMGTGYPSLAAKKLMPSATHVHRSHQLSKSGSGRPREGFIPCAYHTRAREKCQAIFVGGRGRRCPAASGTGGGKTAPEKARAAAQPRREGARIWKCRFAAATGQGRNRTPRAFSPQASRGGVYAHHRAHGRRPAFRAGQPAPAASKALPRVDAGALYAF